MIPIPPGMIGKVAERVADGTITFASAKVVLDELWDMGVAKMKEEKDGLRQEK